MELKSHGQRSLNSIVELWQGPQNTPVMIGIYSKNGNNRPFSAVIETPGEGYSIAVRNTGHPDFPMDCDMKAEVDTASQNGEQLIYDWRNPKTSAMSQTLGSSTTPELLQGGVVCSYPVKQNTETLKSIQVMLKTDGRPLNARIELLDSNAEDDEDSKQVMEVYCDNGLARPFYTVIEAPDVTSDTVVRVINTSPGEYRMMSYVSPIYHG